MMLPESTTSVFSLLRRRDYEIPDDTWIHALLDVCSRDIKDEQTALDTLDGDIFLSLVDLLVSASGISLPWTLRRRSTDSVVVIGSSDCPFKPDCFTFAVSLFFAFLEHSRCFRLIRDEFSVCPGKEDDGAATTTTREFGLLDCVTNLVLDDVRWSDATVRCGVLRALQPLVRVSDAFAWLSADAKFYKLATRLHSNDASIFVRREAKTFLVAVILRRAKASTLSVFVDEMRLSFDEEEERRRITDDALLDCLLTAFYDPANDPDATKDIARTLKNLLPAKVPEFTSLRRWEIEIALFLFGNDAGGDFVASFRSVTDEEYEAMAESFAKCLYAVDEKFFREEERFLPSALLRPIFALDWKSWPEWCLEGDFGDASQPGRWMRSLTRACRTCQVAVKKGLRFEEEERTISFLTEQLGVALARTTWPERKLNAAKVETIATSLSDVVAQLTKRGSRVTREGAVRLADALIVGMEARIPRYPAFKSRMSCLLGCLNEMHRRSCDAGVDKEDETSTRGEFPFSKFVEWSKAAVGKDEVWETSDTILELFQHFIVYLLDTQPHRCLAFSRLLEEGILTWFLSIANSARRFRGPSSSYVRATAVACLASTIALSRRSELMGPRRGDDVGSVAGVVKSEEVAAAVDALIRLSAQTEETEAVVRRAAVAALTRVVTVEDSSLTDVTPSESADIWRRVVDAVKKASTVDFDFDVKRTCVAFWTTAFARARAGDVGDIRADGAAGPNAKSSGKSEHEATDEFVNVLLAMAETDEDLSVKRCAKDALDQLSDTVTSELSVAIEAIEIVQTSSLSPFQLFDDFLKSESRLTKQYVSFGDDTENMADCY